KVDETELPLDGLFTTTPASAGTARARLQEEAKSKLANRYIRIPFLGLNMSCRVGFPNSSARKACFLEIGQGPSFRSALGARMPQVSCETWEPFPNGTKIHAVIDLCGLV